MRRASMGECPLEICRNIYSLSDRRAQSAMRRATSWCRSDKFPRAPTCLRLNTEHLEELCRDVESFWNGKRKLGYQGYAGIVAIQLDGDYMAEEIDWAWVCSIMMKMVRPEVISVDKCQLLNYGPWYRITRFISPNSRVLRLKHGVCH